MAPRVTEVTEACAGLRVFVERLATRALVVLVATRVSKVRVVCLGSQACADFQV